tara:strand:- start:930 stop:1055 length:126 start_codon:yes stop_codon:yes gene_type:complete
MLEDEFLIGAEFAETLGKADYVYHYPDRYPEAALADLENPI